MKILTHYYQPVGYNKNNTKKEVYSNDFLRSKDGDPSDSSDNRKQ